MLNEYKATCRECNATFNVLYGRKTKTESHEVYSCPDCKNLFSLSNHEELKCPDCGEKKEFLRYNLHKAENIKYYKKMHDKELLSDEKFNTLKSYWDKMYCNQCPKCGKETLEWQIVKTVSAKMYK
jgi:DNA-directed RNA polymerase subunit M/transcription elongation factor TFIIS